MLKYFLLLSVVILGTLGQLLLKSGVNQSMPRIQIINPSGDILQIIIIFLKNYYIISGVLLYGFCFFIWLFVLLRFELSFALPFLSAIYILVLLFSWLFLNEHITALRILGTLLVVSGLALVLLNK